MEFEKTGSLYPALPLTQKLAKLTMIKTLGQLKTGFLTIHDREETLTFGMQDSHLHASIHISNMRFYTRVLASGSNGAADSYIDGDRHTPDLTALLEIFAANIQLLDAIERYSQWFLTPIRQWGRFKNRNNLNGSKRNILAHYDISNDFYKLILDDRMQYSSGIYLQETTTLSEAQTEKLKRICDQLELKATDHLLEIGSGWGGLAIFAATH